MRLYISLHASLNWCANLKALSWIQRPSDRFRICQEVDVYQYLILPSLILLIDSETGSCFLTSQNDCPLQMKNFWIPIPISSLSHFRRVSFTRPLKNPKSRTQPGWGVERMTSMLTRKWKVKRWSYSSWMITSGAFWVAKWSTSGDRDRTSLSILQEALSKENRFMTWKTCLYNHSNMPGRRTINITRLGILKETLSEGDFERWKHIKWNKFNWSDMPGRHIIVLTQWMCVQFGLPVIALIGSICPFMELESKLMYIAKLLIYGSEIGANYLNYSCAVACC